MREKRKKILIRKMIKRKKRKGLLNKKEGLPEEGKVSFFLREMHLILQKDHRVSK